MSVTSFEDDAVEVKVVMLKRKGEIVVKMTGDVELAVETKETVLVDEAVNEEEGKNKDEDSDGKESDEDGEKDGKVEKRGRKKKDYPGG